MHSRHFSDQGHLSPSKKRPSGTACTFRTRASQPQYRDHRAQSALFEPGHLSPNKKEAIGHSRYFSDQGHLSLNKKEAIGHSWHFSDQGDFSHNKKKPLRRILYRIRSLRAQLALFLNYFSISLSQGIGKKSGVMGEIFIVI